MDGRLEDVKKEKWGMEGCDGTGVELDPACFKRDARRGRRKGAKKEVPP